jgi:hypothetical protein
MSDLDVLVRPEHRAAARRVAQELGFQLLDEDYLGKFAAPETVQHHDHLLGGPQAKVSLEIHSRLSGPEGNWLFPAQGLAWFWEQTEELGTPEEPFTILKPEAHLLYLCAHAILQHGEANLKLLRLLDLHLLITKRPLDWPLVVEQAVALRWSWAVERALIRTVEAFDTPLPQGVLEELSQRRSEDEKRILIQRRSLSPRWEQLKKIYRSLPPSGRLRLTWETVFPSPAFIRDLYCLPHSRILFPFYLHRLWVCGRELSRAFNFSKRRKENPARSIDCVTGMTNLLRE